MEDLFLLMFFFIIILLFVVGMLSHVLIVLPFLCHSWYVSILAAMFSKLAVMHGLWPQLQGCVAQHEGKSLI